MYLEATPQELEMKAYYYGKVVDESKPKRADSRKNQKKEPAMDMHHKFENEIAQEKIKDAYYKGSEILNEKQGEIIERL